MERQVVIIGAGISGLLACKYTLSKGYNPIVFESKDSIGGVWTKTFKTTKLQTPKPLYQFSDFPWPASVTEDFPDSDVVLNYVESYANHFDLLRYVKFNSKAMGISYEGVSEEEMRSWELWGGTGKAFSSKGKWIISVEDTLTLSTQVYKADFVILGVGRFSDIPNIPNFPAKKGPEAFHGEVIHSIDYANLGHQKAADLVQGKRIMVVGLQKSALDIATECSTINGKELPCTLVFKTAHWNLPDYFPWGFPLANLYLNRFSELLVHKPGEGLIHKLLATLLSPVRWIFAKFVETYLKSKLPLAKYGMIPKHGFHQEINSCLTATVPEKFFERAEEGSLIIKKSQNISFCNEGVLVDGETDPVKVDLVILATGFKGDKKLRNIFSSTTFQDFMKGSPDSTIPLYRECIHPRIPQLAILGFSESISNLFTSEMRCKWLMELFDEKFEVPNMKDMEEDSNKWEAYKKRYSGQYCERSCIGALHIWYNDQLCRDMGLNPRRKKGFIAELFEPYGPLDYVST